jgi:hypothetical protein
MSLHKQGWIGLIVATVFGIFKCTKKEDVKTVIEDTAIQVVETEIGLNLPK